MRPEFWSDALVASMSPAVRLFYIGLWCVADDYGWLHWDEAEIGALLFPYQAPGRRTREIKNWSELLVLAERLRLFACGCAFIPTLQRHQVNGGKKSSVIRDRHLNQGHSTDPVRIVRENLDPESGTSQPKTSISGSGYGLSGKSRKNFQLGNGRERNGSASGKDPERPTGFKEKLAAAGLKP